MGVLKTKGIVISENNFGDYDKMLTILTPGMGKIGCVAKGARRPKSLLMAGSQFLCFGDYMLFKGNNTYTLNSCETIEIFYNIRMDIDKLIIASELNKIILDVTTENQNTYKILQLYLNTLYVLSEMDMDTKLLTSTFKLRLLSLLGFSPNIKECANCKAQENISYFSIRDNGFKCTSCGKSDKGAISILPETRDSIKYIFMSPAKKLYSFQTSKEAVKELEIISKVYFNEKMEKEYK